MHSHHFFQSPEQATLKPVFPQQHRFLEPSQYSQSLLISPNHNHPTALNSRDCNWHFQLLASPHPKDHSLPLRGLKPPDDLAFSPQPSTLLRIPWGYSTPRLSRDRTPDLALDHSQAIGGSEKLKINRKRLISVLCGKRRPKRRIGVLYRMIQPIHRTRDVMQKFFA